MNKQFKLSPKKNFELRTPNSERICAIVGGGPAGVMAAICAAQNKGNRVVLLERNKSIGKKILLTGNRRCNLTNIADLDDFIEKFGAKGKFFRSVFTMFSNKAIMEFFESNGLALKIERQGRVFPITDSALSVVKTLEKCLSKAGVGVIYDTRVKDVLFKDKFFNLILDKKHSVYASKVILATGGASYKATGSTGDGFKIAHKLGHIIVKPTPALVPLKVKETWIRKLQGISLKNVRCVFKSFKKKIVSGIGELMFTRFGVSGPLVLDLSRDCLDLLKQNGELTLLIDLKPGLDAKQIKNRLLREFGSKGKMQLKTVLKTLLPQRFISVFIERLGMDPNIKTSQISKEQRTKIIILFKGFALSIVGSLALEEAMVTNGGICTKQINPETMESKIVSGLYFAGEIIDGCAASGGYNLQEAFSTGYVAGSSLHKSSVQHPKSRTRATAFTTGEGINKQGAYFCKRSKRCKKNECAEEFL